MNWNLVTAAATSLAAVAAFFAAGYYTGRDTAVSEVNSLKRELQMFQSAQGATNLLSYLEDLSEYNDKLFNFTTHKREVAELKNKILTLDKDIQNGVSKLQQTENELKQKNTRLLEAEEVISDLQKKLSAKYSTASEVTLSEGQSHSFFNGSVILGVQSIYSNYVVATIFNEREFLDIAEGYQFKLEDNVCSITPTHLTSTRAQKSADFSLICSQEGQ